MKFNSRPIGSPKNNRAGDFFDKIRPLRTLIKLLFIIPFVVTCGSEPKTTVSSANATFSAVSQQVLQLRCVRCHSTADAQGGVSVSSFNEVILSPGAVTPFSPASSQLYVQSVTGRMPQGGPALTESELQLLYSWISLGAKND